MRYFLILMLLGSILSLSVIAEIMSSKQNQLTDQLVCTYSLKEPSTIKK